MVMSVVSAPPEGVAAKETVLSPTPIKKDNRVKSIEVNFLFFITKQEQQKGS